MHSRERDRSTREGSYPQRRRTPSFSSTLLDAIYRSTDESKTNLDHNHQLGLCHQTTHTSKHTTLSEKGGTERMNLRRAVMLEDWMEKHGSQFLNSTSSSSECSSGGVFSSSETDTTYNKQRPRPTSEKPMNHDRRISEKQKPQREGGFTRTKLRALKIYGELNQKVKQPISPASRIASFLSSIFNPQNVKKAKMCYVGTVEDVSFEHKSKSPCFSSSASSLSRSCMSKTKGKSSNGVKRSVTFYPVSVILGEDSEQLSCHKYVYESEARKITRNSSIKELKNTVMGSENGAEAAARGFIKGYRNNGKSEFGFRGFYDNVEDDDDDDDDDVSCSSSDLFELDHLIGAARYQEELPVYETTNLETNKAIANGLRL
ncbi:protein BIG GRAIN 1-like A [Abrus precatorius]|uniref:Protein BIG GRAIN 1-like A n=1 Tax=Abrus precatorius TaxID=3816 RepID=A0A8B8MLG6_ABRPR|nr:protein BIG GRAIN 1-like A [Abrus precatorius]